MKKLTGVTAKAKAYNLCWDFAFMVYEDVGDKPGTRAKRCAIKCVNEIIENQPIKNSLVYWNDVINEINKL